MSTIYGLCDPDTLELRYVGKARDPRARLRSHRWESRNLDTHKGRWLASLDVPPLLVVLEEAPDDWAAAERRWISELRAMGARLTNYAPGGQTSPVEGRGHTEETKAKLRAAQLRIGNRPPSRLGIKASPETREKLSAALRKRSARPPWTGGWNKGLRMSDEAIEKNRLGHVGRPWSPARRAAQQRKAGTTDGSRRTVAFDEHWQDEPARRHVRRGR